MRPIYVTEVLATADDDGVSLSQTPLAGGNLTITGALASGGVATLDTQRQIIVTSGGNDSGRTFTLYGTDGAGNSISEAITGANIGAAASVLMYATVTRVAIDAASAGTVKVGTNGVGASAPIVLNQYDTNSMVGLAAEVTGTVNYTVQYTYGKIMESEFANSQVWFDHPVLAALAVSADSYIEAPASALRIKVNSGAGSVRFIVRQAGLV